MTETRDVAVSEKEMYVFLDVLKSIEVALQRIMAEFHEEEDENEKKENTHTHT